MYKSPLMLKENLYYVGVGDPDLRAFDIIMESEFGTTYNAYVAIGDTHTVLFDTAKEKFADEWLESLKKVCDPTKASYLVVSHTEPDHAGSIGRLLDINPGITIVATACANQYLKHIVNRDFRSLNVKDGMTLDLGGKTLVFMPLPNLHWPDTMYTYVKEDAVLVTCDSFGAHYCTDDVLVSAVTNIDDYHKAAKYYFDNIIGPFKDPYMIRALARIAPLTIDMILPGHGPVLNEKIDRIIGWYREWTRRASHDGQKRVAIAYVSSYGYTRTLAGEIVRGIKASGSIRVDLFDLQSDSEADAIAAINDADAILLGTPTILGEALSPIWDITKQMFPPIHGGKLASAFGSYGWSGEGVPHLIERLRQLRMNVVDGLRVRLKPNQADISEAFDFGYNIGCLLQSKPNDRKKKSTVMMKCLVCGELLPEGTLICPVCGVGADQFVKVERDEVTFKRDTNEIFAIIGAGNAGVTAAKAIRQRNATCGIVLVNGERELPYNRPMLTKNLFGQLDASQIPINDAAWYEENNITLLSGETVSAIDTGRKELSLASGSVVKWDKLIIATGSYNFVPPIAGVDGDGVYSIRSLDDARKVASAAKKSRSAVVVGGGVLGLETAWEFVKYKLNVTVVEAMPRLLAGKIADGASVALEEAVKQKGVKLMLSAQVSEIRNANGKREVVLSDGTAIPCDVVVLSTGIRAASSLASNAGISVDRGIVVDERMETSVHDVYACGDCAIHGGVRYGLWAEAGQMGNVAGANAAGDDLEYKREPAPTTLAAFETPLFALGDSTIASDKHYKTMSFSDPAKGTIEAYHFLNDRLAHVTLFGDVGKTGKVTELALANARHKDVLAGL